MTTLTRDDVGRAGKALERRAERARESVVAFFELAAREEHTRERVRCLPHQQLLFAFIAWHRRSLIRSFVGSGKTYSLGWFGLHCLGNDITGRGAIIGASVGSASKVLSVIRDAIEDERGEHPEVHLVFPDLVPSPDVSDPWGQNAITIERPGGIRDPSFVAVGVKAAKLPGSRLKWLIVDDMLDEVNTATREARDKLERNFGRKILTRADVRDAKIVVDNTPWEHDDLTFKLEQAGWPTLSMEVEGEIRITNVSAEFLDSVADLVRPSRLVPGAWRLRAHDAEAYGAPLCEVLPDGGRRRVPDGEELLPGALAERFDVDEAVPLWPEKFGVAEIAQIREDFKATPGEFMAKYKLRPRAPADEAKKRRWIEECKLNARALGARALAPGYRGPNLTFTGIDVATGLDDGSDLRAIFTFEQIPELAFMLPDGTRRLIRNARRILNVQFGRWTGAAFIDLIEKEARDFRSFPRVETNGAQSLLRQWLAQRNSSLAIEAHVTGHENKHHRINGVAGVLIELENFGWVIPCDERGQVPEPVEQWIAELLDYRPERHPGDVLIASWLAREQARAVLGDGALPVDLASVAARFRA